MTAPAAQVLSERLASAFEGLPVRAVESSDSLPTIEVPREYLLELARRLRELLGFESITLVTAVDLFPTEPRFRLVEQFLSIAHRERLRVHTPVPEADPIAPSITGLWPGASFLEREVFDMFGIRFDGHPKLERLLMPDGYGHFPLRKDFPHQGIEPDRLYREWDRGRRQKGQR